mmetsp:Transcript_46621/g.105361  ORF Transcript_46621/g.105361 Transcript_46621/m.105361 type:complete len:333 (+) Transcript_46621:76-1074(+)
MGRCRKRAFAPWLQIHSALKSPGFSACTHVRACSLLSRPDSRTELTRPLASSSSWKRNFPITYFPSIFASCRLSAFFFFRSVFPLSIIRYPPLNIAPSLERNMGARSLPLSCESSSPPWSELPPVRLTSDLLQAAALLALRPSVGLRLGVALGVIRPKEITGVTRGDSEALQRLHPFDDLGFTISEAFAGEAAVPQRGRRRPKAATAARVRVGARVVARGLRGALAAAAAAAGGARAAAAARGAARGVLRLGAERVPRLRFGEFRLGKGSGLEGLGGRRRERRRPGLPRLVLALLRVLNVRVGGFAGSDERHVEGEEHAEGEAHAQRAHRAD